MRLTLIAILLFHASHTATADESSVAKQYKTLLDQYEEEGGARAFAKKFLALAEAHPKDPASADALLWVVTNVRGKPDTTRALQLLTKHHPGSRKLGSACKSISESRSVAAEKMLRAVLAKNPDKQVQAQACFHLASLLDREANLIEQLKADPKLAPRVLQYYGNDYGKHLSALDAVTLAKQRELVYAQMLKSFPDVEIGDAKLGAIAEKALFAIRHLSVGRNAPEIKGVDVHGKAMKLSDFRGKVVLLSFWAHW